MERLVELLRGLDQTTSTLKKVEFLKNYFEEVPSEDACWGLFIISGQKIPTKVNRTFLQDSFCEFLKMPMWLFKESSYNVGDSSETMALLRGPILQSERPPALGSFVEDHLLTLKKLPPEEIKSKLHHWWRVYDEAVLFLIHKCFSGNLRMGVSKNLLIQALAQVAKIDKETMSFRLMGDYKPTPASFENLLVQDITIERKSKPYPYFLASPVENPEKEFQVWQEWCVEWKWDGIRAQVIKRDGEVFLWSRGEELINESFPEVLAQAMSLPDGTVIDGELLPFKNGKVLSFNELQTRLNRKKVSKKDLDSTPVSIMAYDLLEWEGEDIRTKPLRQRRDLLQQIGVFPLSELVEVAGIEEAKSLRVSSRERGVEGFMLKQWESPYQTGRKRGQWWKWKIEPLTIDCVLLYAQSGTGRRSSLYTDYTLAVWKDKELIPVTKAYSGLTDEELTSMDNWIKKNTVEKFGPVRSVKPLQVFEIAFEGINVSTRHKAGVALRFPRILCWRKDKKPEDADSLDDVKKLLS
ncbi:MAG TPA: ATP-dependent DNA ligase [Bacteriovoracaceae bacterium]|nr:ATP-dependent DNA ligase [Bacteriovoracaceae bacterium]